METDVGQGGLTGLEIFVLSQYTILSLEMAATHVKAVACSGRIYDSDVTHVWPPSSDIQRLVFFICVYRRSAPSG